MKVRTRVPRRQTILVFSTLESAVQSLYSQKATWRYGNLLIHSPNRHLPEGDGKVTLFYGDVKTTWTWHLSWLQLTLPPCFPYSDVAAWVLYSTGLVWWRYCGDRTGTFRKVSSTVTLTWRLQPHGSTVTLWKRNWLCITRRNETERKLLLETAQLDSVVVHSSKSKDQSFAFVDKRWYYPVYKQGNKWVENW